MTLKPKATVILLTVILALSISSPSSALISDFFGWGFSDEPVREIVDAWEVNGTVVGLVGVISPPAGAILVQVWALAKLIDPPALSIISGRGTLQLDPSDLILDAGWYGEFGLAPLMAAPVIGDNDLLGSVVPLMQTSANPLMDSSDIGIDNVAGTVTFEFDWGPGGFTPTLNLDAEGHLNFFAVLVVSKTGPPTEGGFLGSPADTLEFGIDSPTYMLCDSGFCGSNVIPEPSTAFLLGLGLIGLATRQRISTLR